MANQISQTIAKAFMELAGALETGKLGKQPKIAVTGLGSEHGEQNALEAALKAHSRGVDVTLIGRLTHENITTVQANDECEAHKALETLLESREIDGVVTMHYPFPIGVSTVGRVITPGRGRELFLATTTGTSSADRVEGLIKNAIYGIITAKACGIQNPTVGILNIDGARQAEIALKQLHQNGYPIAFASSGRSDGGCIMRGNDLLAGSCDVMVTDPLTGNVLVKMLSAYTTGGSYESMGYGYGPGIGEGYDKLVLIVSRASGAPVIANAMQFTAELVKGDYAGIAKAEFALANTAGLKGILEARKAKNAQASVQTDIIAAPAKEVVTFQLSGIEIMDLEDGVKALWKAGIYAESGMGCTGPIILVNDAKGEQAAKVLKEGGFITQ